MSFSIFRGGGGFALKVIKTPALSTSQKTYCVSLSRLQPSCWNVNPILRLPIKMQSTSEDAGSTASSSSSSYSSGSPDFLGPLKHHIKGQQSDQREEAAEVKKSDGEEIGN
ncbi:UNVERIFIED_CONTAM: hypothetical protein Sradi_2154900 [Sesamum radiatum]|uniref:Uncharacterized protein n=1 Tax=Sesamum radiatum TaxID=300843 RepID=A0AAW2T3C4_SESRA